MKITTYKDLKQPPEPDLTLDELRYEFLSIVHDLAKANGSTYSVELEYVGNYLQSKPGASYANAYDTQGYYAVLYLVDQLFKDTLHSALYTSPNEVAGCWFAIRIAGNMSERSMQAAIKHLKSI